MHRARRSTHQMLHQKSSSSSSSSPSSASSSAFDTDPILRQESSQSRAHDSSPDANSLTGVQADSTRPRAKRRNSEEEHEKRQAGTSGTQLEAARQEQEAERRRLEDEEQRRRQEAERLRRGAAAAHLGRVDTSGLRNQVGGMLQMSKGFSSRFLDRLGKAPAAASPRSFTPAATTSDMRSLPPAQMDALLNAERDSRNQQLEEARSGSNSDSGKMQPPPATLAKAEEDASVPGDSDGIDEDDETEEETGFDVEDEDEDDMHANGVPAARGWRLDARRAKTASFRATVLAMLSRELELDTWSQDTVNPRILPLTSDRIRLKRISGAFSNAVFFVSYDTEGLNEQGPKTVLLRVYGSGTEVLLSRRAELLILHTLSSLYEIGPHILGTFANGRVETYFDAEPIGKEGIRDLGDRREAIQEDGSLLVRGKEGRAQWVARRMRQLHEVPLETMKRVLEQGDLRSFSESSSVFGRGIENHLFARSHRPRQARGFQQTAAFDPTRAIAESPAPLAEAVAEEDGPTDTSMLTSGVDGARARGIEGRAYSPHRNDSVASFDSLATSYNSLDAVSIGSMSTDTVTSPNMGSSSYFDSHSFGSRRGSVGRASGASSVLRDRRRSSTTRSQFRPSQPYPGMWRRSKRWAREAGKVFAIVEDFCQTAAGKVAYRKALKGTSLENTEFSPFTTDQLPRLKSTDIGTTNGSLKNTLLAIAAIDFPRLLLEMDAFKRHVRKWERRNGISKRVLAHGDTQYSNLLLIKDANQEDESIGKGMPRARSRDPSRTDLAAPGAGNANDSNRSRIRRLAPYECLIVIDFEYCSPNPRAYDIANAFHEWRFDYHHPTDSWSPMLQPYPTRDERRRWLRAYVEQGRLLRMRGRTAKSPLDSPAPLNASQLPIPPEDLSLPPPAIDEEDGAATRPGPHPKQTPESRVNASREQSASSSASRVQQLNSPAVLKACSGVEASPYLGGRSTLVSLEASMEREIDRLEREVEVFSPACHASWALWGVTFAKESIEAVISDAYDDVANSDDDFEFDLSKDMADIAVHGTEGNAESFDNLRYALGRVELFRAEIAALGISV